ncbi:dolichyl-phosphate beta-glucosyltransferase [Desulfatitalea alkaliphila]|uniref:dolichyl-phosphate beta-glucosyltransferase n=1 Tax=Desulfatitalea alkaliphila TaxID=2929485 RepID=A0AA41UJ43_9BACT|nr:glycosyltransferase family 2 protein [Desulfatitalea alkaliphila]
MKTNIDLSIIIPAYNEQDRIVPALTHTMAFLKRWSGAAEVIVVSDGSKDRTVDTARGFEGQGAAALRVLHYEPNRGKGYAVRYGMQQGRGAVVMFMDADYAVPIEYCETGLGLIAAGNDIAIASRAVAGAKITQQQNLPRRISAKVYTWVQNRYLGIDYPDTQCGFKLFTQTAARTLFARQRLDSVIFDPEILFLARRKGYKVAQFPVHWTHMPDSRIQYDSLRKSLFVFKELWRIRRLHP